MTVRPFDAATPLPPRAYKIIRRTDDDAEPVTGPDGIRVLLLPWLASAYKFAIAKGWGGLGSAKPQVAKPQPASKTPPGVESIGDRASSDVDAHLAYMLRGDDRASARAEPGPAAHLEYITRGDDRGAR